MVSFTRKFISFGNRREKNLSDVADKRQALTNIANTISGDGTFSADDLDCIQGLQYERTTPGILGQLTNSTVKVTGQNNELVVATPIVTIKDRVENARDITGKIPAYQGGLGLNARFIKSTEINVGNVNSTGSDIFDVDVEQPTEKEYWEGGIFYYNNFIDPTFTDQYGGIQWIGYFSPEPTDPSPTIGIYTTGLLIIEYELNDSGTWTKLVNYYAQTRPIIPSATTSTTSITIDPNLNQHITVAQGDFLASNPSIEIIDVSNTSIDLSSSLSVTSGQAVSFTRNLGETTSAKAIRLPLVEPGIEYVKLRISYWYPDNGADLENKSLRFSYGNINLPFFYLYSQLPVNPGPNEFRSFLNTALSPYNNKIGNNGTNGNNYRNLTIGKTYLNEYVPKNSLTGIRTLGPINLTFNTNSAIGVFASTAANASIGNYIVPASATGNQLPKYIQIKNKFTSTEVVFKEKINATGTQSVNVIDHKGFIDWHFANSVGSNVTVSSTAGLTPNNIVITSGTTNYVRIHSIIDGTTFRTANATGFSSLGLTTNQPIYIYSEKGITDKSKLNFCSGVFGAKLAAIAPSATNSLLVTSNSGIAIGQVVQYTGAIPELPLAPMTTVTNVAGNTVTLSNTTTQEIANNSTITFAPAGTDLNKEACVIPLDTAPPFEGSATGLRTINRGAKSTFSGNFVVETSNLVFVTNTTNVTTVSGVGQFNRKIRVTSTLNNNTYFILSSNTA